MSSFVFLDSVSRALRKERLAANNVDTPCFPFLPNPWSGVIPPVVTNDFFVFK
jgi:hypothetical protein